MLSFVKMLWDLAAARGLFIARVVNLTMEDSSRRNPLSVRRWSWRKDLNVSFFVLLNTTID